MSENENSSGILSQEFLSRVVIVCVNGRSGTGGGMEKLRNKLRQKLSPFGIPRDNIMTRSWNRNADDDPFSAPNLDDLKGIIRVRARNPTYLALIGHSYGGWACSQLSRSLKLHDRIHTNFVGLVDPVYGPSNSVGSDDWPEAIVIRNWYQNNGISAGNQCLPGRAMVPCSRIEGGVSCGYRNVRGAEIIKETFVKKWNGDRIRKTCELGRKIHLYVTHTTMDDNKWIWRQCYDQISEDLDRLGFIDLAQLEVDGNAEPDA